jgi:STE24 endopeptidase
VANEDKATHYHRLQRRVSLLATLLGVAFLSLVAFTGAGAALARGLAAAIGPSRGALTAAFAVTLLAVHEVLELPLAFYRGVALERRYGLSSETLGHWWATHLKGFALGTVLMLGAAVAVSWLLAWSPGWWWLIAAALFAALLVAIVCVAPVWLFPIFYDFTPLERPALSARLLALARQAGTSVSGVFEWRLGDRTRKANAALVGLGRTRRILLSDTLLAAHSDDEIEVVLAHELAHHVHGDLWASLVLQVVVGTAGLYAAHRLLPAVAAAPGVDAVSDVAALPIVALAAGAVSLVSAPLVNAVSRAHERRADRFAIEHTRNAAAFISAIRRLAAQNLAEEQPPAWVEALFHSHPSTNRRLEAARRWTDRRELTSSGHR